jgi:hypothetical protein
MLHAADAICPPMWSLLVGDYRWLLPTTPPCISAYLAYLVSEKAFLHALALAGVLYELPG